MSISSTVFSSPPTIFTLAFLLRAILLAWGIYQDANSPFKYTDIDYYVFTDASRYISRNQSPYARATYRYTPLLAWLLYPTTWPHLWFHFGKALFALSDLLAGWMIFILLRRRGLSTTLSLKYASVWLLNPMVANISTRGSSEGLLCVLVMGLLWAFETDRISTAGIILGTAVHFKIYPFIYGASMLWALPSTRPWTTNTALIHRMVDFLTNKRLTLICYSLGTFIALNLLMYTIYGHPFLIHTFIHHLTRLDHRHNFSPYNTLLYLESATNSNSTSSPSFSFSRLAFLPQLTLSTILLPLLARHSLPATMFAQTLAFATFNKVATSQYFLWYLVFLPLYLPKSSLMRSPKLGLSVLAAWVGAQALWLQQGYALEFLGESTFVPGLWGAGLGFFAVNCWVLGIVVGDIVEGAGSGKGVVLEKKEAMGALVVEGEPGPAVVTTPGKVRRRLDVSGEGTTSTRKASAPVRHRSQG
jgi:phosphatidylinositol glycan class M